MIKSTYCPATKDNAMIIKLAMLNNEAAFVIRGK
jgi:hypothetical protein